MSSIRLLALTVSEDRAGSCADFQMACRHVRARVLAAGDLVVAHGVYHGLGQGPIAAFDLWCARGGKIVEHWDAHQPWVEETVSGHSMIDGPTEVTEPQNTDASRELGEQFVDLIMMGRDRSQIGRFFNSDHFVQHNPQIADGVSGLGAAIQTGVWAADVERAHRILADGEFVFTQGEGTFHGSQQPFTTSSGSRTAAWPSTGMWYLPSQK
jgi:predicted SnoaL-like aldol condensation-catalyzing enzyme